MLEIQAFMAGLDELYAQRRIDQIEPYLLAGLEQTAGQNPEAELVILNDLMGYYRAVSRHEDMVRCSVRVLALIHALHLENTVNHGTTLLNIATGYRAAGKYDEAEACYRQAQEILEAQLSGPDYRLATLYNNLGLLYIQTGRLEEAKQSILKALPLTQQMEDSAVEQAITYTNLGNVCFGLSQTEEAADYMQKAVALFEQTPGLADPHYPAALAGLGQVCFTKGELEASAAWYEKSLHFIEKLYGRNDDWHTTQQNLEVVQDLLRRKQALAAKKMKGLALARAYYEEVGRPLLAGKYARYADRIAVGLVGEGSECLGYDDGISTDHDFGPGFCLWLTKADYAAIGKQLQADYDALPKTWRGLPVRNTTAHGAGRVGVCEIDAFYKKYTGYAAAPAANTPDEVTVWANMDPAMLRTATNGEVFRDELGLFSRRRAAFAQYPEPARLARLAAALHTMAQAGQYNYSRAGQRKDVGMQFSALAEFVQATAEVGYLLNRQYMPYYKWRIRGMADFTVAPQLKPMLESLLARPAADGENAIQIEAICRYVVAELTAQQLTDTPDSFLDSQKDAVLRKLDAWFAAKTKELLPLPEISPEKELLVEKIVRTEWNQFQQVQNEGGRASCQDNWPTFQIMRKSQFLPWSEPVLASYLADLEEGNALGWNLVTEKYARMMAHTAPEAYRRLAGYMPPLDDYRVRLQEQLIAIMMRWTSETHARWPYLSQTGRNQFSAQDSEWDTSSETYLRGELSTYSDGTLKL